MPIAMTSGLSGVLGVLLKELVDGADASTAWVLNNNDPGLLRSLDKLSAEAASAHSQGCSSIAAHVDHLRYGLGLLNRWGHGEDPFADADYSASWQRLTVSDEEWIALRAALGDEASRWRAIVAEPRTLSDAELTGMVASVAHIAYHLGAIRQIDLATRGPRARD